MRIILFVRRYKNSKVLSRPVYDDQQRLAADVNRYLDLPPAYIRKLFTDGFVKAPTKFGSHYLSIKYESL